MQRSELIVGQRYHVKGLKGYATYAGVHDGELTAADGTKFYGADKSLRFLYDREDDTKALVLIKDGREIIASEEAEKMAKAEKERHQQANTKAKADVVEFLAALGFPDPEPSSRFHGVGLDSYFTGEDFTEAKVQNIKVKHLIEVLERHGVDMSRWTTSSTS